MALSSGYANTSNGKGLNLRAEPNTNSKILAAIPHWVDFMTLETPCWEEVEKMKKGDASMIIVIATLELKDGAKEEFTKIALACVRETRKEIGNISYTLLMSPENPNQCTFIEEWETKEALEAHAKTPHYIQMGADVIGLVAKPSDLNVFMAQKVN